MADTTKELTRHEEQIKYLKEKQDKTEKDLSEIRDSINNLDKNVALFAQTMTEVIVDNKKQDEAFKAQYLEFTKHIGNRADVTQEIYAELQEIKASQELMYTNINSKNAEQDEQIKAIKENIVNYKSEIEIETKRLEEAIDTYINRTKFDWFDMFNEGVQTVFKKGMELGAIGLMAYIIVKIKEKLL